jgi:hypothetical protein
MKFTGEKIHVLKLSDAETDNLVGIMMVEQGEQIDLEELTQAYNAPKGKTQNGYFLDYDCLTPVSLPFVVTEDGNIYIRFIDIV